MIIMHILYTRTMTCVQTHQIGKKKQTNKKTNKQTKNKPNKTKHFQNNLECSKNVNKVLRSVLECSKNTMCYLG